MTAAAPASSAILACSGVVTSMMTPPSRRSLWLAHSTLLGYICELEFEMYCTVENEREKRRERAGRGRKGEGKSRREHEGARERGKVRTFEHASESNLDGVGGSFGAIGDLAGGRL